MGRFSVTGKLGNMRKAVEWTVYPASVGGGTEIMIQSNARIARFNVETGAGMLSKACPNGAYGVHLNPILGATPVVVPKEMIAAAVAAQPKSGAEIGPGVYVA